MNKHRIQIQFYSGFGPIVAAEPPESATIDAVGWMDGIKELKMAKKRGTSLMDVPL